MAALERSFGALFGTRLSGFFEKLLRSILNLLCEFCDGAVSFYVALMILSGPLHLNWFRFSINEISTFGQSLKSMREINSASKKIGSSKLTMFRKPDGKW